MSEPLKKMLAIVFPDSTKDEVKDFDIPAPEGLYYGTPREFQIGLSENFMKPNYGNDVFGVIAVRNIEESPYRHIVVSDSGFAEEVIPLIQAFGRDGIKAIQISRPGCNYDNDSRSDLNFNKLGIQYVSLKNEYDIDLLTVQVERIMTKWNLII